LFALYTPSRICFLAQGRVAFYGDPKGAFNFFSGLGFVCPAQYNPADYFIEMLSTRPNDQQGMHRIQSICDAFAKSDEQKAILKEIDEITEKTSEPSTKKPDVNRLITEYEPAIRRSH
jgi:hypothetical protein